MCGKTAFVKKLIAPKVVKTKIVLMKKIFFLTNSKHLPVHHQKILRHLAGKKYKKCFVGQIKHNFWIIM